MWSLFYYENYASKIWWLITFEPFELKQIYIPQLKMLVFCNDASSFQWYGFIFILCDTHVKLALLLDKPVLVNFPIDTTVVSEIWRWKVDDVKSFSEQRCLKPYTGGFLVLFQQRLRQCVKISCTISMLIWTDGSTW